jgi:hypothetical protein
MVAREQGALTASARETPVLEMAGGVRLEKLAIGNHFAVDTLLVTKKPREASSADACSCAAPGSSTASCLRGS